MRSINIYLLRMLIIGNHNVLATHATALIGMVRLSPTALWLHTAQWSDSEQREYFRVELLVSMNIYHLSTNIHNEGTILKSYHFLHKGWHGMIGQGTGVYFYFFILLLLLLFFFKNSKTLLFRNFSSSSSRRLAPSDLLLLMCPQEQSPGLSKPQPTTSNF